MITALFLDGKRRRSTTTPGEGSHRAPWYLTADGGLFDTPSFKWLVAAIKASCRLDYAGATALASIQAKFGGSLGKTVPIVATLETDWDPLRFIEQQGYKGPDWLPGVLTLSGTANNTQMLPCRQYLRQTWPFAGEIVLEALVDWIKAASSASRYRPPSIERRLFDGSWFEIASRERSQETTRPFLKCVGPSYSNSEIIEVFTWLASTLREASGAEIRYSVVHAKIQTRSRKVNVGLRLILSDETFIAKGDTGTEKIGNCWHDLFNNPVVSKGFPVPLRPPGTPGLEISLEAMGILVGAPRLTIFNNRAVLKGFNAAIFATACTDETVLWHLVVNKDGSRIRYSDKMVMESLPMEMPSAISSLQGKRHFLGWAPDVSYNIGSPSANYNIGWPSLDFVGPGCALEKLIISGGPGFLSAGAEFSLGRKDNSPLIRREMAYFDSLNSLSHSYIVLYDTLDCRAWLSNGLHTLLHLVRASLRHDKEFSDLADECLFDPLKLHEDPEPSSSKAAINFLRSRNNLEQPIFPGLDEIRTEQATSATQTLETEYRTSSRANLDGYASGVPLRLTPRSKLEGYRFMDVAIGRALSPRMVRLDASGGAGKSWVDFTRSIKAVTLFGEGFGELLKPRVPNNGNSSICDHWKTLPKGKDHLAVAAHDLVKIFRQEGSAAHTPLQLAAGIFWEPTALFGAFSCRGNRWRACNHAQALLPKSYFTPVQRHGAPPLHRLIGDNGAVVFGRSSIFPFSWPDRGGPTPAKVQASKSGIGEPSALEHPRPPVLLQSFPSTTRPLASAPPLQVLTTSSSATGLMGSQSSGIDIQEPAPLPGRHVPIDLSLLPTTPPTSISLPNSTATSQVLPTGSGEAVPEGNQSSNVDIQPEPTWGMRKLLEFFKGKFSLKD
ncbi:hypothetical protein B0T18DRAFT_143946 [Schizothecium vesticola]|uniref:Uncharacterized protein n=1 Tax=Schizothecium vesticola TaxID=314040 RepID=A0AA40EV53_9PEZI|nr:hypothetical protein B0T18DRAFT_143946 [Schizothecium vesticola]